MISPTRILIKDLGEATTLAAWGFSAIPCPNDNGSISILFEASNDLLEARRDFLLNRPVPCRSFIEAAAHITGLLNGLHRRGSLK